MLVSAATPLQPELDAGTSWPPGPRHPLLPADELHVWLADLSRVDDAVVELLDGAERDRADRLARRRDRAPWSRSRGVLRGLLARYVENDARSLKLVTRPAGKPVLADEPRAALPLHFNLSHSGHIALYVVAADAVGVDVELVRETDIDRRRGRDHVALARRSFGAPIAERLARLDETAREREFLRLWTRHEAALKLAGRGIAGGSERAAADAWIAELDLGAVAIAAVASERPAAIRLWSFG